MIMYKGIKDKHVIGLIDELRSRRDGNCWNILRDYVNIDWNNY